MANHLFETVRCVIRPFRESDIEPLDRILRDPDVMQYLEPPFTPDQTRSFLQSFALCRNPPVYAVEMRNTAELAGYLIFHPFDPESYEIGWVLKKSLWRLGIAGEITDVLIPYANSRGIRSLVIECDPQQTASVALAVRHGFRLAEAGDLLVYRLDLPGRSVTELPYFRIGDSCGGSQEWFKTFKMRIGGCGAATACDSSIYFARQYGLTALCPFDPARPTRAGYVDFGHRMERYLWPRMGGINRLDLFMDGYGRYLSDCGETRLSMTPFDGKESPEAADALVREQLGMGYPVPVLILNHQNAAFRDYVWHWFLLTGHDARSSKPLVKAVTFGKAEWLSMKDLWDTGCAQRGGMIRFSVNHDMKTPSPI